MCDNCVAERFNKQTVCICFLIQIVELCIVYFNYLISAPSFGPGLDSMSPDIVSISQLMKSFQRLSMISDLHSQMYMF